MAVTYVDLDGSGSATAPYDTWAKAATDVQTGLTAALAGGTCYVRTDSSGTNVDTVAADRAITSPGTKFAPTRLIGVANNASEPPVSGELSSRGDADTPVIETTGSGSQISTVGFCYARGIKFDSAENIGTINADQGWTFEECEFVIGRTDTTGSTLQPGGAGYRNISWIFYDCDVTLGDNEASFAAGANGTWRWFGGTLNVTATVDFLFDDTLGGTNIEFIGIDMSALDTGVTLVDRAEFDGVQIKLINCRLPASYTLFSGSPPGHSGSLEVINSNDSTAISTSVLDYEMVTAFGSIIMETTKVRTGGATDGEAGSFAYKFTVDASVPTFPLDVLRSKAYVIWLDGTETQHDMHIANDGARDLQNDEVWSEVWASNTTPDTAQYILATNRMADILATPADQTDDTGSTWGGSVGNHQILRNTIAPGYKGFAHVYICAAQRDAAPLVFYVDPKPVIT